MVHFFYSNNNNNNNNKNKKCEQKFDKINYLQITAGGDNHITELNYMIHHVINSTQYITCNKTYITHIICNNSLLHMFTVNKWQSKFTVKNYQWKFTVSNWQSIYYFLCSSNAQLKISS